MNGFSARGESGAKSSDLSVMVSTVSFEKKGQECKLINLCVSLPLDVGVTIESRGPGRELVCEEPNA